MEYCFCTLVLGEKYHRLGKIFLKSFVANTKNYNTKIIVVTDYPGKLVDDNKVIQVPFDSKIKGSFVALKWLAYRHALEAGYDNICYVDADSVAAPEFDENIILDKVADGMGCTWLINYTKDFPEGRNTRGTEKLKKLVNKDDAYPVICPVECFMFLKGDRSRSLAFISEWERIQQQIVEEKLWYREVCHEIGLAAKRTGVPVYKYPGGSHIHDSNFKHFGTGAAKQKMIDLYE